MIMAIITYMRILQTTLQRFANLVLIFPILLLPRCAKPIPVEKEPNDTFASATEIPVNSSVKGLFNSVSDRDYFRVEIKDSSIMQVELSAVKGINHALMIWRYDDKPLLLKKVDDNRKSSPEILCNAFIRPGTYYITVLHGDKDAPTSSLEYYYHLKITTRNLTVSDEQEPNDNRMAANTMDLGREMIGYYSPSYNHLNNSGLYPLEEEDWYEINLNPEKTRPFLLDIDLSAVAGINAELQLLDSEGQEIAKSDSGDTGEGEQMRGIGIRLPGRYYLVVSAKNFQSSCMMPYTLRANVREYDDTVEMEPNDVPEKANLLEKDQIRGRIFPAGDRDFFLFKRGLSNNYYRIVLEGPEMIPASLRIYDERHTLMYEIPANKAGRYPVIIPNAFFKGSVFLEIASKPGDFHEKNFYNLKIEHFPCRDNYEKEPNDQPDRANKMSGVKTIVAYITHPGDTDYFLLIYPRSVRKRFVIKGIKDAELKVSITDSNGFILKNIVIKGDKSKSFREAVDKKGFLIVQSLKDNSAEPYTIQILND